MIINPVNNTIYAGGSYYNGISNVMAVSKSTDAGMGWTRHELTSTQGYVYAFAIHPTNSNIVFAGGYYYDNANSRYGKIFKSTDGGNSWTDVSSGISQTNNYVYSLAIDPASPDQIYAGCRQGIFKSTTGGSSWTNINNGVRYACSILFSKELPGTIYAATQYDGVYFSSDNGKSWSPMNEGLTTTRMYCMDLDYSTNTILVGTDGDGVFRKGCSPPQVINPMPDITVTEDFGTISVADLDTVFEDIDGDKLAYSASSYFGKILVNINGSVLTLNSKKDLNGVDNITVNALDNTINVSVSDKFSVTLTPVNDPPVLANIIDVTFPEDGSTAIDLDNYVTDVDNSPNQMTFSSEVINASNIPKLNLMGTQNNSNTANLLIDPNDLKISINPNTHVATFTTTLDSSGIFTVVFKATDPGDLFDTDTIQVTVAPVNDPPQISQLPELTFNEDDSLLCHINHWCQYVTDPENEDSALSYLLVSGPHVTAVQRDSNFLFFVISNWFGKDTLKLIVSDGFGADTADQVIKVNPINDPPIFTGLPDSIRFHNDLSAEFNIWDCVQDEESQASDLEYSFIPGNDSLHVDYNNSTGFVTLTAPSFVGIVSLFISATDDSNATVQDTVTVKVDYPTGVDQFAKQLPEEFLLSQNFPNPFNMETTIEYQLPHSCHVELKIFNLLGQEVRTLIQQKKEAGYFRVNWDGTDNSGRYVNTGIYIMIFQASNFSQTRKLIVLK